MDWKHREAARARIRVLVKKILRKYGYPPDLQGSAVQTVLQQAGGTFSGVGECGMIIQKLFRLHRLGERHMSEGTE